MGETLVHESVSDTLPVSASTDQAQISLQPHLAVVQLSVVPSSAGDILKEEKEAPVLQSAKTALVPLQSVACAQQTFMHERRSSVLPTYHFVPDGINVRPKPDGESRYPRNPARFRTNPFAV